MHTKGALVLSHFFYTYLFFRLTSCYFNSLIFQNMAMSHSMYTLHVAMLLKGL